jgi:hypothetical protein
MRSDQRDWPGEAANEIDVPMETISNGPVKMHCCELYDGEQGAVTVKGGSRLTIKAILIPSPWNTYPKIQIASALEFVGSMTASVLKATVPTSI